jgi:hypothetical protein
MGVEGETLTGAGGGIEAFGGAGIPGVGAEITGVPGLAGAPLAVLAGVLAESSRMSGDAGGIGGGGIGGKGCGDTDASGF